MDRAKDELRLYTNLKAAVTTINTYVTVSSGKRFYLLAEIAEKQREAINTTSFPPLSAKEIENIKR